jgi:hypothetical protein
MLCEAAAAAWAVPVDEVTTETGKLIHKKNREVGRLWCNGNSRSKNSRSKRSKT